MRQRKRLTLVVGNTTSTILTGKLKQAEVFPITHQVDLHKYVGILEDEGTTDWQAWNKIKQRYSLKDIAGADYLIDGDRRLRDWHKRLKESARKMEKAQSVDQALFVA